MKKITLLIGLACILKISAQTDVDVQERVITTAVPFLTISGDARASGLGDIGVATSADGFSQQWNPAKFAFAEHKTIITASYTPFLENVVSDVGLLSATFANKISDNSAFAFGLRFFSLGEIELRQTINEVGTLVNPNEFALDASYSLKLSETFSMAVGGRFISSNLRLQDASQDSQAGNSFAVDIAGFYQSREVAYNNFDGRWRLGFNISNLGASIQYEEGGQENFLPANLGLGAGFDFILDADNVVGVYTELNKLLVPTPRDFDGDGDIDALDNAEYQSIGFFTGAIESFSDAPDGFSEELREVTWALGTEYKYQDVFMLRAGYFNESPDKGSRQFATIGAGFKFKAAQIDLSYLFSTAQVRSPLENSLRFSLSFNLGEQFYNN